MKQQLTPRLNRLESNIIIDGGMEIWPESTSRSVANNTSAYGAVLFKCTNAASAITITNSQQTSVPSNTALTFSNQVSKTATGTLAAGTAVGLEYHVEGYDVSRIYRNEFSLIFWAKSSIASNRSVGLRNGSGSHSYVQQYNIAQTNTWELKVLRFDSLNTCPGTIERGNLSGARFFFNIVSGSTFQTATLNAWQGGSFVSGMGEDTTWLTGTTHDFSIAGAIVLPGDWTDLNTSGYSFIRSGKNFADEVTNIQRYYEKSYNLAIAPGTITTEGQMSFRNVGGTHREPIFLMVQKRANPTFTSYNPVTGASGTWRNATATSNIAVTAESSGEAIITTSHSTGGGDLMQGHWTADIRF